MPYVTRLVYSPQSYRPLSFKLPKTFNQIIQLSPRLYLSSLLGINGQRRMFLQFPSPPSTLPYHSPHLWQMSGLTACGSSAWRLV